MNYTQYQIDYIIENYSKKGGIFCAAALDLPVKSIQSKANRLGLKVDRKVRGENTGLVKLNKPNRAIDKYNVDARHFMNIEHPEIVYILGFLWADGYLQKSSYKITIGLVKDDIEAIKPYFDITGKWNISYRERKNRKPQGCLSTSNFYLYDYLRKNGYESKSIDSADGILSKIPENLRHYWFRGYFDGDGCLYIKPNKCFQMVISSSYDQNWHFMEEKLTELGCKWVVTRMEQNNKNSAPSKSSRIRLASKKDVKLFMDYIYPDGYDGIGLFRKSEKMELITFNSFLPFEEARDYARSLGLKTLEEWNRLICSSGIKPKNIPASPESVYKDKGWVGAHDWLHSPSEVSNETCP